MVVVGDVDTQEVHVDGVLLPDPVQQHGHLGVVVDSDGEVRVLHDGNLNAEMKDRVRGAAMWRRARSH